MIPRILLAVALTVAVETPIVALVYRRERWRMALACALATTATNLGMNASLAHFPLSYWTGLVTWEVIALVVEAVVYVIVSKEHEVPRALVASGLANAASFAVAVGVL